MTRSRRLVIALAFDLAITGAEIVGGLIAHSAGLLATAGHDLTDGAALTLALVATVLVGRPPTPTRSFGWHRVTILTALANAATIVVVSVLIAVFAIHRLVDPVRVHGGLVIVFALVAVAGNGAAAMIVHERSSELNMRAAALHLFADAAAALGVVAAGAVILGTGGLMWLDPAVSLAIAAFVIAEGVLLVRHSIDVLLESTPADLSSAELSAAMVETPGVAGVHDLHCWSLSTELRALSAHLLLHGHPTLEEAQAVGDTVKDRLRERFGIAHATLELECEPCIHPDVDSCAFEAPAARSGAAPGPARTPPAAHAGR